MKKRLTTILFALLLSSGLESVARAYEADVNATVDAQFYTLQSPYGDPVVRRRRYTQTLGVNVYGIQGDVSAGAPQLSFRARMRMDADLGQNDRERDPAAADRFSPGLEQTPIDLMYAYLDGQNYLDGYFGFRIGRQYVMDALGFWSFDGALLRLTTPVFLGVEVFGGFEQRGGLPLSTPRWQAEGVYRGDRSNMDFDEWPSYLDESELAPAYGFALESTGLHWLSTRLSYRKTINRDTVLISPYADAGRGFLTVTGDRVSSERLGYSARVSVARVGAISGNLTYDLYNQELNEYLALLDWYATSKLTIGGQYEYYLPTFDGDSIFNWFSHNGMTTATGRINLIVTRGLDFSTSGGVRTFRTEGNSGTYRETADRTETGALHDVLGTLAGRYRWADGSVALRAMGESGERGHRTGADATITKSFDGGFYDALVIVSLYDWADALRPSRDATSVSYVLGGGVSPFERTRMGLEWEQSANRLVDQRYRLLATLELTVLE